MKKVCIIGNLNVDLIMGPLNQTPEWGKERVARYFQLRVSGQVGYAALALSNLGVEVNVIANVGDDYYGRFILQEMKKFNINIEGIKIMKEIPTGITVSLVNEEGERALISYPGSMEYFNEKDIKEKWQLIEECQYVVFNGYFLLPKLNFDVTSKLLAQIQDSGKTTLLDTGWDPSDWPGRHIDEIKGLLKYTDIFLPNLDEARIVAGNKGLAEVLDTLVQWGPSMAVIKMGQEGSVAIKDGKVYRQPSFKVKVTDTTGAGDTFNAGFLYGVMNGWNLNKTLKFATALASLYICSEEEVKSLSVEKVQSFLKSNFI